MFDFGGLLLAWLNQECTYIGSGQMEWGGGAVGSNRYPVSKKTPRGTPTSSHMARTRLTPASIASMQPY